MASNGHMTVNSELDRVLRKLFWPKIGHYTGICTEPLSKTMKTSVRIANVQAEIRTRRLPNASLKHFRSLKLARMGLGCITLCCCGRLTCVITSLEIECNLPSISVCHRNRISCQLVIIVTRIFAAHHMITSVYVSIFTFK
jgi:hypothetical protein